MKNSETVLDLRNVRKEYTAKVAVEGLDLAVQKGEFVSLLGPSGCGKTTTIRMIAGYVQPTAGQIILRGQDVTELPPQMRNMGMVFQDYALFPHMTVLKNVTYGLRVRRVPRARRNTMGRAMLDLVGLADSADLVPGELSGGMRQRVAVARALATDPELLLLDEPFSALDAKKRENLRQEVRRIHSETGITTILVTHDQSEAFELSDRVVLMNQGSIEQIATPRDLYHQPATHFATDFIGRSVKLPGVLFSHGEPGGPAKFRTKTHATVEAHAPYGLTNQEVTLAIRPEAVEIRVPPAGGSDSRRPNTWAGVIRSTSFFGPSEEIQVFVEQLGLELPAAKETRARFRDWKIDQAVQVSLDPRDVLVIPAPLTEGMNSISGEFG